MSAAAPQIYLVARPSLDFAAIQEFLKNRDLSWSRSSGASGAAELIELAGRVCYLSFTDDISRIRYPNKEYISNLINKGHESVLEHTAWSFVIDRVSRSFTHQLVRHRIGFAFSQLSQQYHEEADAAFVVPSGLADNPQLLSKWKSFVESSRRLYRELIKELQHQGSGSMSAEQLRALRSTARSVLPNAVETAIVVTANARALRHFFDTRGAIMGDAEMRQVAVGLFELVSREAPELFQDFEVQPTDDGIGAVAIVN